MTVEASMWDPSVGERIGPITIIQRAQPIALHDAHPHGATAVWVLVWVDPNARRATRFEKVKLRVVRPGVGEVLEPTLEAQLAVGDQLAYGPENIVHVVTVS